VTEREMIQLWVDTWKKAGPGLEAIRRKEIAEADNVHDLMLLAGAFNHAVRSSPAEPSSGLVEMQRIFAKLRQ
jgi:hypothetical protein